MLFDTLYLMLTLGHEADEHGKLTSRIDPPSETFRVRLVVTLLECCGSYLAGNAVLRRRLDRFLLYFQRYLFLKEVVPIDLQFAVSDLLERLCPKMVRARSIEEVADQIRELESSASHAAPDRLVSLWGDQTEATTAEEGGSDAEGGGEEEEERDEDEAPDADEDGAEGAEASYADKAAAGGNALLEAAEAALALGDGGSDDDSDAELDSDESDADEWERADPRHAPRRAKEEDEFAIELDRMMADAIDNAKMQPRTSNMATVEALTAAAGLESGSGSSANRAPAVGATVDGEEAVAFRFLSRSSNKRGPSARPLWVPADADMAASTVANAAEAQAERADLKRLVLRGLQRTERELAEEERLGQAQLAMKDRKDGVVQDFSHRQHNPAERAERGGGGGGAGSGGLHRVGANLGAAARADKPRDLGLKLESFAFASEETLTASRVTLQGDSRRKK